ncbi:VOC family protein [Gulosibacter sp. ACHW.36C]|uniref:VOC family protein n=1 Tax=Gulosibacter sediminis TaxID=1729695 RepID=A0ABY4MXZ6_9MICO|nr:VOC family protein [Gulosibacter sediminis]UQN15306.1 VOC family protein [Gulosibacter sediminis]
MITKFGNVMIYVENPRDVADFWVDTVGFTEVDAQQVDGATLFVELTPTAASDAHITLFDRNVVAQSSPELDLATPSILFKSPDITAMRDSLAAAGTTVGDIVEAGGMTTFNFADPEGNWFAVKQVA